MGWLDPLLQPVERSLFVAYKLADWQADLDKLRPGV